MKRLLLPLIAALALPTAVNANVDPRINQMCMSASDYKGCVELYTEKFTLPKCNTFRKTKCTGEIKYTNATYVGEKSNEKEHGFGTLYFNNGNRYVGQFVDGERTGQGTLYWADGDAYVGQWRNDKRHGQGTFYWADGDTYVGQFVDGERTGQGTFVWGEASKWFGDRYVGQFKNGKRHGQGTYFYKSGSSWSGEWKDGDETENGSYTKSPEEKAFDNQLKLDLIRQQQQRSNDLFRSIMGW